MMERLTMRISVPDGKQDVIVFTKGKYKDTIPAEMTHDDIRAVLRKLAEYENAEEQGLLVKVECHCKDCVHWVSMCAGCTKHVKLCTVGGYMVGENGYCVYAEQKLKEMESD